MEQAKLESLKSKLLAEQQRLNGLLERTGKHLHRDEPVSADFAEQAVEVSNDEVVEHLDEDARIELQQISAALKRIDDGRYGVCVSCDENINEQRLEAVPFASECIDCAKG